MFSFPFAVVMACFGYESVLAWFYVGTDKWINGFVVGYECVSFGYFPFNLMAENCNFSTKV